MQQLKLNRYPIVYSTKKNGRKVLSQTAPLLRSSTLNISLCILSKEVTYTGEEDFCAFVETTDVLDNW